MQLRDLLPLAWGHTHGVPQTAEEKLCWEWETMGPVDLTGKTDVIAYLQPPPGDKRHKFRTVYWGSHYWGEHLISQYPCVCSDPGKRRGTHR